MDSVAEQAPQPDRNTSAAAVPRDKEAAPAAPFARFTHQPTVLLTSYRRDGTPVGTPVNIAVAGDRAFFRTWDSAGKARRLRRNPDVTIAPSTLRGRPTGPAVGARARLLEEHEATIAARAIARKHPLLQGVVVPVIHRLRGNRTVHYELTPVQP